MFRHVSLLLGATICLSLLLCLDARPYSVQEEYLPLEGGYDDDTYDESGAEKRSIDLSVSGSLSALSDMVMWQRQQEMQQQLAALGKRTSGMSNRRVPALFRYLQRLRSGSIPEIRKRSGGDLSVLGSLDALSDIISSQHAKHLQDMMQQNHQGLLRLGKRDTSASLEKAEKEETKKAE